MDFAPRDYDSRDDERDADLPDVRRMPIQVGQPALDGLHVFPAQPLLGDAAVHLEGADGGDQDDRVGIEFRLPRRGDDVHELLKTQVRAEPGLGLSGI